MSDQFKEYIQPGKKNIILVYILFLSGFLFQALPLMGAAFAYAYQNSSSKVWNSHYLFAFRSFCFCVLGFVIAFITTFVFIGPFIHVLVLVWFIVRGIIALQFVFQNKHHPDPFTLWIK